MALALLEGVMKTIAAGGLMLCLALAPSIARAEMSTDDRVFAAALETRLKSLDAQKQTCVRGVTPRRRSRLRAP
jgi:hypothetical protein